jgi:hypothetical protein
MRWNVPGSRKRIAALGSPRRTPRFAQVIAAHTLDRSGDLEAWRSIFESLDFALFARQIEKSEV